MNFPPPKSQGHRVMTSDFVTILDGFLPFKDDVWSSLKKMPEFKEQISKIGERRGK